MEDRVQAAYCEALRGERERYLDQQALKKVQVITRSMKPAEKEAYLQSQAFATTVLQVRRRDRVYQALGRGELVQAAHRSELDQLAPLIGETLRRELPVDLAYLRTVARARVTLEQAEEARRALREQAPKRFFAAQAEAQIAWTEGRVERFLKKGEITRLFREDPKVEFYVPHVMETVFGRGVPLQAVNLACLPQSLTGYLRGELYRAYPALAACGRVAGEDGRAMAEAVKDAVHGARGRLMKGLQKRFPAERIRALIAQNPRLISLQRKADRAFEKERRIRTALLDAIPEHYRDLYPLARQMRRRVILHIGPTNSGKTHESVQRLHGALNGIYLGPLRLLAAEQFEAMNLADVPCSLVTGEEQIRVPGSRVQSSTVEMADLQKRYDVAVVDECQMIGDRDRGGAWSAAVLGLCAEELHLCASPDAEGLLTRIITDCGDSLSIVRHERMTPLTVEKEGFQFPASVRAGDALIVFSKARVHAVAADLRSRGYRVSLIYGALPPEVRRNQADRFLRGETDVVVSTDAIAMGMNLPIERVVFLESEKYDGDITRTLTDAEIKQIAGRAGRYGKYDIGYVNAFGFKGLVASALARPLLPLTEAVVRFPESLLGLPLPLTQIIDQWLNMQDRDGFSKASAVRMAWLAALMETRRTDKRLLYQFICIPFDETDPELLQRWKAMYQAECTKQHLEVIPELPMIQNPEDCTIQMLDGLEADYRRCDLYYNYARLFLEDPDPVLEEIQRRKDLISQGIVHILSTQKLQQKVCHSCKKRLPWNWPYRLCDQCFRRKQGFGRRRYE